MRDPKRTSEARVIALSSVHRSTVLGSSAVSAGISIARTTPVAAANATSCQIVMASVKARAARPSARPTKRTRATITTWARSKRSANMPPTGASAHGAMAANVTPPTAKP